MVQTTQTPAPREARINQIEMAVKQEDGYNGATTALATTDITKSILLKSDGIAPDFVREFIPRDSDTVGTGSEFETAAHYENTNDFKLTLPLNASAEMLAIWSAFALGTVSTAALQTDKGYVHTITPMVRTGAATDGTGGVQQPPSTAFRILEGNEKYIAEGIVVNSLTFTGVPGARAEMSVDVWGSGEKTTNSDSFTAVGTENYLKFTKLQIGVAASEIDMSNDCEELTFTWNNNLQDEDSRPPGAGLYRTHTFLGTQRKYELSMKVKQHSTDNFKTWFDANTALKVILTFEGAQITSTSPAVNHGGTITLYQVRITEMKRSVSGAYMVVELSFDAQKDGSNNYCAISANVGTGGPATLLTVAT